MSTLDTDELFEQVARSAIAQARVIARAAACTPGDFAVGLLVMEQTVRRQFNLEMEAIER